MTSAFRILIASPDTRVYYNPTLLNTKDRLRATHAPILHERRSWQTSRFLKQQLYPTEHCLSLSHSKNHASLIASTFDYYTQFGIDMEQVKQRDFSAFSKLCMSLKEQNWLKQQTDISQAFYQLWTLKECIIKAKEHLTLADMPKINLIHHNQLTLPNTFQIPMFAYTSNISQGFIISCLYPEALGPLKNSQVQGYGTWESIKINWQAISSNSTSNSFQH